MIRFILAFFISASICLGASFPISNGVLTTPLNANSQQINNLADPTSAQDAATKNWSLTNLQPLIANLPIFAPGTITMGNGDVLTVGSSGTVTTLGNITNSANGLLKLDGSGIVQAIGIRDGRCRVAERENSSLPDENVRGVAESSGVAVHDKLRCRGQAVLERIT